VLADVYESKNKRFIILSNFVKICEGVQSIDGTLSEKAKKKQKPFKIWKGKSFIEVLNPVKEAHCSPSQYHCSWAVEVLGGLLE